MISASPISHPRPHRMLHFGKRKPEAPYSGQIQYFYSSPLSELPVRDVTNAQRAGIKTEPHIENGAENFIKACSQHNIRALINNHAPYLFLVTRCVNKSLEKFFNKQFIVGFIKVEGTEQRQDANGKPFMAVQGETRIVSYADAVPVQEWFGFNFNRARIMSDGRLDAPTTQKLVDYLSAKPNVIEECVKAIHRLDPQWKTCIGQSCRWVEQCLRLKVARLKQPPSKDASAA